MLVCENSNSEKVRRSARHSYLNYLVPRLGKFKLKEITSPMIAKLLAELLESGGGCGRAVYSAHEKFLALMHEKTPKRHGGGFKNVARKLGIGEKNTIVRVTNGSNVDKETAVKIAKYYAVPLTEAFEKKHDVKPLSASYVSKITYTLSALFSACVKNGVLLQNPVANATKPRIGEQDVPSFLDNTTIPIFLETLNKLDFDNNIRV